MTAPSMVCIAQSLSPRSLRSWPWWARFLDPTSWVRISTAHPFLVDCGRGATSTFLLCRGDPRHAMISGVSSIAYSPSPERIRPDRDAQSNSRSSSSLGFGPGGIPRVLTSSMGTGYAESSREEDERWADITPRIRPCADFMVGEIKRLAADASPNDPTRSVTLLG